MTNYEAENPSSSTADAQPDRSWDWLRERISASGVTKLTVWIEDDLVALESQFSQFMTKDSLKRDMRKEFSSSRRHEADA